MKLSKNTKNYKLESILLLKPNKIDVKQIAVIPLFHHIFCLFPLYILFPLIDIKPMTPSLQYSTSSFFHFPLSSPHGFDKKDL